MRPSGTIVLVAAGAFALPTHGNPVQAAASPRRPGSNLRSVYRVLLGEAMSYESGIRFAIELTIRPEELFTVRALEPGA